MNKLYQRRLLIFASVFALILLASLAVWIQPKIEAWLFPSSDPLFAMAQRLEVKNIVDVTDIREGPTNLIVVIAPLKLDSESADLWFGIFYKEVTAYFSTHPKAKSVRLMLITSYEQRGNVFYVYDGTVDCDSESFFAKGTFQEDSVCYSAFSLPGYPVNELNLRWADK